ncbi:MAG: uroporphyrinogen decarboxylase [Anaerolineae bacterium]|nr:uroporphyrinogen decarboxylase [Anaerolineae bacterium]
MQNNGNAAEATGKELIFSVLRHQETARVPWVPFAGVHAGKLTGYTGREVLTDGDKLFESLMAVNKLYAPDGQPVVFDLQVEAEILGCNMLWADAAPPSVASHPLAGDLLVPSHLPQKSEGRLPMILDVMRRMKSAVGENTALYGLITGPFTLASHLRGTDIFLDMVDHEDYLNELLRYCREVARCMADYYIEAGMDIIALVDPLVSQISPRHFKRFLAEHFSGLFDDIRSRGVFSSFFVCGDATKNIEVMCQTNPDCIAIDENIDMAAAKAITDRYNIAISGNIPLTTRMLLGSQQDNMKYVIDLMDSVSHHNLIISPGCDMPYDVPVENAIGVMQAVREPDQTRQLLENYHATEINIEVELPDYASLKKPLIEVFTIDSETCAACGYMYSAARRIAEELPGKVDVIEYKITKPENVARVKKHGIKNLPCIFVNGELKFSSIIPSNRELMEIVQKLL